MTAEVALPVTGKSPGNVTCDGHPVQTRSEGDRIFIDSIGSGTHTFSQ